MAKLTSEMKEMVANNQCWITTCNYRGLANLGPKASTQVVDDEHLAYYEVTGGKTWENVQENPRVVVATANSEELDGYRFVGEAEIVKDGPLYENAKAQLEESGFPPPKAVIKTKVKEIYSLKAGPMAGKRID